jgi:hypothetical protein
MPSEILEELVTSYGTEYFQYGSRTLNALDCICIIGGDYQGINSAAAKQLMKNNVP